VPAEVNSTARHLFYLHGAIIERAGERPTHPDFGVYEYRLILEAFAERDFVVISEARAAGTDVFQYAQAVADQVRALITAGVPPANITVVGFSKGGGIAAAASSILSADEVSFVFMGTCGPWLMERPEIVPHGRLLSLHEASDDMVGSCDDLFARSGEATVHRETVIEIGGGHGAFYRPRPEWVDQVVEWASRPAS
jgi:dienelactone hydrolase